MRTDSELAQCPKCGAGESPDSAPGMRRYLCGTEQNFGVVRQHSECVKIATAGMVLVEREVISRMIEGHKAWDWTPETGYVCRYCGQGTCADNCPWDRLRKAIGEEAQDA